MDCPDLFTIAVHAAIAVHRYRERVRNPNESGGYAWTYSHNTAFKTEPHWVVVRPVTSPVGLSSW